MAYKKITFNDFLTNHINDYKFTNFDFLIHILKRIDKNRIDFDLSYIDYDETIYLFDDITIVFTPLIESLLPCSISFDMSYGSISTQFSSYEQVIYMERCGDDISAYKETLNLFTQSRLKMDYYYSGNNLAKILGYFIDFNDSYINNHGFLIFFDANHLKVNSELVKEEFYESIIQLPTA